MTVVLTAVMIFVSVLLSSAYFPELNLNLVLFLIGLTFLGIPHGALDIFLMIRTLSKKYYIALGIAAYLVLSIPLVVLWPIYPTACFVFFLTYSLIHFADSDTQSQHRMRFFEFAVRLPLPFFLPFAFHKEETLKLLQLI